jgi:hypothetical protein
MSTSFLRIAKCLVAPMLFVLIRASAQDADHAGKIAPELVGKWCYYNLGNGDEGKLSNTCVTLNADGSYEFFVDASTLVKVNSMFPGVPAQQTDYGTWWVRDNSIYYNSQSKGSGSFQFQKMNNPQDKTMPMIVLNGATFAPAVPRDPW